MNEKDSIITVRIQSELKTLLMKKSKAENRSLSQVVEIAIIYFLYYEKTIDTSAQFDRVKESVIGRIE